MSNPASGGATGDEQVSTTDGATPGSPPDAVPARDGVQCLRQRAFLVARLRGGVSRSAIVAIADGTRL